MRRAVGLLTVVLSAAGCVAGCGGGDADDAQMVRTGPQSQVRTTASGTLASNPVPLTLKKVDEQPAGSARRAVLELLFWAQWGSWPHVADLYHPAVKATVGLEDLTGAYALLRNQLAAAEPRLVSSTLVSGRATIQLELLSATNPPQAESFVLQRSAGAWRVVADTLLERGLTAYVQGREGYPEGKPSRAAITASAKKAAAYRAAFALAQRSGR